jgi:hypothetical protein
MRTITTIGRVAATVAVALLTLTLLPQAASAAAITKITDSFEQIGCEVVDGDREIQFALARSDEGGTDAVVNISTVLGDFIAYGRSESDWSTPGAFRASVELRDDPGEVVGMAYISGSYAESGAATTERNRFKDGNIHVLQEHTTTPLRVTDVTMVVLGQTMAGVDCGGESVDGFLSFTNPNSYVYSERFNGDGVCTTENAVDFGLFGTPDALWVEFWYADSGDWSASSDLMNLLEAPFTGTFTLNDGTGPAGEVAATASLVRNGDVIRMWQDTGTEQISSRITLTPYLLEVAAEGPNAPMSASCTYYDVDRTVHIKDYVAE